MVVKSKGNPRLFQGNLGSWQFFVTFLGWLSDPLKWLSDLQIGDPKGHFESPGW